MFKPKYIFMLGIATSLGLMTVWQRHEALKIGYEIARLEAEKVELQEKLTLAMARLAAMESPPMAMARVMALRIPLRPPDPTCAVFSRPGSDARPEVSGRDGGPARRPMPVPDQYRPEAVGRERRESGAGRHDPGTNGGGEETAAARPSL
ncbi:MAG: hypothetical protein N3A38_16015 [Planctomycetota bacterium]|nr:hypothetical protein [Planctomycetota bacterium]